MFSAINFFYTIILILNLYFMLLLKVDKAFLYCSEFTSVPERDVRFKVCHDFF